MVVVAAGVINEIPPGGRRGSTNMLEVLVCFVAVEFCVPVLLPEAFDPVWEGADPDPVVAVLEFCDDPVVESLYGKKVNQNSPKRIKL